MDQPQLRRRPVIRVFVSSTFTDLMHERDALQRDVFPKLEQLCASRQFQFQAIDLRWGVPTEASLDPRTMRICFEELRRSQEISPQPNFLILLGNRYGWRPLPEEVSEDEFLRLEQAASSGLDRETLRAWYQRDENAVPSVYLLGSRKKNLNDGRDYTNDQVWNEVQRVLWDVINRAYPAAQLAGRFDHLAVLDEPLPSIVRFQASATEQEIWRGALGAPNACQHVLAFVREIENVAEFQPVEIRDFVDVDESGAIDAVARDALRELKRELRNRLGEGNVIGIENARLAPTTDEKGERSADVATGHLEELCARVHAAFKDIITRQLDEYWGTSDPTAVSPRELELERSEHQRFGQERAPAHSFVGRERHLQAIQDYLHDNSNQLLVIHGASGSGKTALLARAAQDVAPEWKPIVRFIGVTPRSSDVRSLLVSLCQELRQRHPLESPIPGEVRELSAELNEHFKAATAQAPLILFLDALDQLADADNGTSLFWIPQLPGHVKLIVSGLSDRAPEDPASQPYTALKRRGLAEENFINLNALSENEAQTLLFERWLPQARRKLNGEQTQCIRERLKSDVCCQPLYLKVLFEEARLWRSNDPASTLGNNVSELLGALFQRLAAPANHGPTLECALGYIAAARRGLTEMEILEVLYQDPDYAKFLEHIAARTGHKLPDNPKRIPIAIWSRLRFDLSPYLAEHAAPGGTVLNFYHRQVAEFVRSQFLDTPLKRKPRHERLAGYFDGQDYFLELQQEQQARAKRLPPTPRPANVRKVDELPWQRLAAAKLSGEWDAVEQLFTDVFYLEAKAEAGLVFDLIGDFAQAAMSMPAERPKHRILTLLEAALRQDIQFIYRHPTALFQCIWNTCWWFDCTYVESCSKQSSLEPPSTPAELKISEIAKDWLRAKEVVTPGFLWLRSLRPFPTILDTGLRMAFRHGDKNTDEFSCVSFSPDGRRIIAGSRRFNYQAVVRVWNAATGEEVMCLTGHEDDVTCVAFSPDGIHFASGDNTGIVRLWNSMQGTELKTLSGHTSFVKDVKFSRDGARLISCGHDGMVRIWETATGQQLHYRGRDSYKINCIDVASDDCLIACGMGWSGNWCGAEVWDLRNGRALAWLPHDAAVYAICFSPDGSKVLTGAADGQVREWNLASRSVVRQFAAHNGDYAIGVAYSRDKTKIICAFGSGGLNVWDVQTGELLFRASAEDHVTGMALASDAVLAATSHGDGAVRLWNMAFRNQMPNLIEHEATVNGLRFSADSRSLLTWSADKTARQWNVETGEPMACFTHETSVWDACLSPGSQWLATGCEDGTANIWEARESVRMHCLRGHRGGISRILFTTDGSRVITCSQDSTVRVWDVTSGAERHCLVGHEGTVRCVDYCDVGDLLVTGSVDGSVRVWELNSGRQRHCFEDHKVAWPSDHCVRKVLFARGGRVIISGAGREENANAMRSVRIWDVSTGSCLESADDKPDFEDYRDLKTIVDYFHDGAETVFLYGREWGSQSQVLARFPVALHPVHDSSAQIWAAAKGCRVYMLKIEGDCARGPFLLKNTSA